MTRELWTGVWVTIDSPWSEITGGITGSGDLLACEIPFELFAEYEWVEEGTGYREALIPAADLNRYRRWRAWECVECDRVAPAGSPGWRQVEVSGPFTSVERYATCPDHADADVEQPPQD